MNNAIHFLAWMIGLSKPWTYYSAAECALLERYADNKNRLAEIGCWQGVNTARLRKAMANDGLLFAVDPYPKGRFGVNFAQMIAKREVSKVKRGNVRWLQKTDLEAAAWMKNGKQGPLDFVFSDSLNTYEGFKACWEAWSPLLMPGGIYVLANSHSSVADRSVLPGSVLFTRDIILKDPVFELLESLGSFTVLRKK